MKPRTLSLLVGGLFIASTSCALAADLQTLIDRSPFAPAGGAAPAEAPVEQGVLEFRGMVVEPEGTSYSIFDASSQKARWLRVGEGESFRVKNYDTDNNQLEIEQNGKTVKLSLKRSTIQAGPAVANLAAPPTGGQPGNRPPGSPDVRRANAPADAQRLEAVAAEVRRRRALRNAAANPGATPAPAPAAVEAAKTTP